MTERIRVGHQRAMRMRRIGAQHMIVMPPQVAQVMSIEQLEQALNVAVQQTRATEAQLARQRAYMLDLQKQIEAFKALPIERDDDDPEVPQPEPAAPVARRRELRSTTLLGGSMPGGPRTTTPVGFGEVPAGATPVPPPEPELTAADA